MRSAIIRTEELRNPYPGVLPNTRPFCCTNVGVAQQLLHVLGCRPVGKQIAGERVPLKSFMFMYLPVFAQPIPVFVYFDKDSNRIGVSVPSVSLSCGVGGGTAKVKS